MRPQYNIRKSVAKRVRVGYYVCDRQMVKMDGSYGPGRPPRHVIVRCPVCHTEHPAVLLLRELHPLEDLPTKPQPVNANV